MVKVLITVSDCKQCSHSSHFTTNSINYEVVVCDKTRTILLVADKGTVYSTDIKIPANCPLPDLVEDKH